MCIEVIVCNVIVVFLRNSVYEMNELLTGVDEGVCGGRVVRTLGSSTQRLTDMQHVQSRRLHHSTQPQPTDQLNTD